ncbi:MAG: DUF6427 family protein [Chitinophagaceae bacterium]
MVSLFKTKSTSAVVWITLLCIFVHLPFIFEGPQIILSTNSTLLDKLLSNLSDKSGTALFLVYLIIISLQANRLNAAANNLSLFPKENALPGMVYVLFTALLPQWNNISSTLIINTLFIEILASFRLLYTLEKKGRLMFNLSLVCGIASILYPPTAIWVLVLFFALVFLGSFSPRLAIVWIVGLLLPFYFLAAYLFLNNYFQKDHILLLQKYMPQIAVHNLSLQGPPLLYLVAFGFILLTVLLGILNGMQNSGKLVTIARKVWGLCTLAFVLTVGNAFLLPDASLQILQLSIVPAALLGACTFYYSNAKWLVNVWFWLITLGIYYTSLHTLHIIRF